MAKSDVQAILLAAGKGSRIPELVSSHPKCLLPIGNRPAIYYPLHALESAKFSEVIIAVCEGQEEVVSEAIQNQFQMRIEFFAVPKDEEYGTPDTLRLMAEQNKILDDFLIISCDTLTNYPLDKLINLYRIHDPALIVLLSSSHVALEGSTPGKKGKPDLERDLIGIDSPNHDRLVFFNSELDFEDDIPFTRTMLKRCPQFRMYNSYLDSHIYIMKRWVLNYVKEKRQIRSIKSDLIPTLVRKQFKSNLKRSSKTHLGDIVEGPSEKVDLLDYVEIDQVTRALENKLKLDDDTKSTVKIQPQVYPNSVVKCFAAIQKEGLCIRANTVTGYFEANKRIRAMFPSLILKDKPPVPTTPTTPNQGPIKTQIGTDCIVASSNEIGDKTSIKRSSIGEHCIIGEKVKITNCVIMNHVKIQDNCNIQGSIICENSTIGASAEIKDCIVVANQEIVGYGKFSNEVIPSTFVDATDDF